MFENVKIGSASEVDWGRLVKTWATGKSNFPAVSIDKLPVPRTLDELKAQCALVGVEITVPAKFTGFAVIQHGPETLALRLPAKAMVEAAEADLDQGLDYTTALLRGVLRSAQRAPGQAQGLPGLPHRRLLDRLVPVTSAALSLCQKLVRARPRECLRPPHHRGGVPSRSDCLIGKLCKNHFRSFRA